MFTGIITDVGRIEEAHRLGDLRLRIGCGYDLSKVELGASIACSGVCLTVVDKGDHWFAVDVSQETVDRSAPRWQVGARLNLERALRVGDELGGHIVTGHVDGVGECLSVTPEGGSLRLMISAPAELAPYIAAKGSIALDGVSLTVNEVSEQADGQPGFGVNIIPHTAEHTSLGSIQPGDRLNIEIDILARYIGRMHQLRPTTM